MSYNKGRHMTMVYLTDVESAVKFLQNPKLKNEGFSLNTGMVCFKDYPAWQTN